jgi:DNA-binding transcriptional ArsR family regulator
MVEKSDKQKYFKLERMVKGFANHRRIEILFTLEKHPELSVEEVSEKLKVNFNTISDHIRKLAQSGLVMKRSDGKSVRHAISNKEKLILLFCKMTV